MSKDRDVYFIDETIDYIKTLDTYPAIFSLYRNSIIKTLLTVQCANTFFIITVVTLLVVVLALLGYVYHSRYYYTDVLDTYIASSTFNIIRFRIFGFVRNAYLWYTTQLKGGCTSKELDKIKWAFVKKIYPAEFARLQEQNLLKDLYESKNDFDDEEEDEDDD